MSKALLIENIPGSPHYRIRFEGGGELPSYLSGSYTTITDAKRHIEVWESVNRDEPIEVREVPRDEPNVRKGRPPKALGA